MLHSYAEDLFEMKNKMTILDLARKYMAALNAGDVAAARNCLHPDAEIWHNYDGLEQSVDQNMATLEFLLSKSKSLSYDIHRQDVIESGYLQRHTLHLVSNTGIEMQTEAIAIISVKNGKITRIEEFLDPSPFAPLRDL